MCGCVCVFSLYSSCWWWLILWMRIFERWSVFCLISHLPSSSVLHLSWSSFSLYLCLPAYILYHLRNHYSPIKVWTNTLPPATLCVCMRVCECVLCLKSLNILKTETSFNYPLITLLITCHTHIHHWPDCTHMRAYTHSHPRTHTYTHTHICHWKEFLTYRPNRKRESKRGSE